jgi:ankyrin repeat protein
MHAQVHAVELGYGGREPAGSIKWWWDLSHLAAKEMDASEGERVIEILRLHALKASAATSALAASKQATSSEKEKGGRDEVLGVARGARQGDSQEAEAGPRQPLHACVRQSDELSSRLLLALAAQVDARDPKASTPLMIAAVAGHAGIVKVLLSHGACLDAEDRDGLTALHWSTAMGHLAVVEALVKAVSLSLARAFSLSLLVVV